MKSRLTKLCSLFLTFAVTATTVFSSDLALVSAYADDDVAIVEEVAVEDAVVEEAVVEEEVAADAVVVESLEDGEIVEALDSELPGVSVNSITYKEMDYDVVGDTLEVSVSWNGVSANKFFAGDWGWDLDELEDAFIDGRFVDAEGTSASFEGKYTVDRYTVAIADADNNIYYDYLDDVTFKNAPVSKDDLESNKVVDKGLYVSFGTDDEWFTQDTGKFYYTGKTITPSILVADGDDVLKLGKDYTVSYKNNKNAATFESLGIELSEGNTKPNDETKAKKAPYVEIKFKGDYKGTASIKKYFEIVPAEFAYSKGVYADYYLGKSTILKTSTKAQTPKVAVTVYKFDAKKLDHVKTAALKATTFKADGTVKKAGDYEVKFTADPTAKWDDMKPSITASQNAIYYAYIKGNGVTLSDEVKSAGEYWVVEPAKNLANAKITMSVNNIAYDKLYDACDEDGYVNITDKVKEIKIGKEVVSANVIDAVYVNVYEQDKPGKNVKLDVVVKEDAIESGYMPGVYYGVKSNLVIAASKLFDDIAVEVAGAKATAKGKNLAATAQFNVEKGYTSLENVRYTTAVKVSDNSLVEDVDYEIVPAKKVPVIGKTKYTIVGLGKYAGEKKVVNLELKATIDDAKGAICVCYNDAASTTQNPYNSDKADVISTNSAVRYAKKATNVITAVSATWLGDLDKKDYAISYSKITDGAFTATVKFKGNYKSLGKLTVNFTTVADSNYNWTRSFVKSTKELKAKDLIKKSAIKFTDRSGATLKAKDYTVSTNLYKKVSDNEYVEAVSANGVVSANVVYYAKVDGNAKADDAEGYSFKNVYVPLMYGVMFKANQIVSTNNGPVSEVKTKGCIAEVTINQRKQQADIIEGVFNAIYVKDGDKTVKLERVKDYYIYLASDMTEEQVNEYMSTPGIKNFKIVMNEGNALGATGTLVVKVKVSIRTPKFDDHKNIMSK